jgi:hypothetical protein
MISGTVVSGTVGQWRWETRKERAMKTFLMILWTALLPFLTVQRTQAAMLIYMPVVTNQPVTQRADPNATFQLDHVRLWSAEENGGAMGAPIRCGAQHKVQVHVFDVHGDSNPQSRLDGVIVRAVYLEQGHVITAFYTTGMLGREAGVVEVSVAGLTEISIFTDANGRPASSHLATVTTAPAAIPLPQLVQAGFCQDDESCRYFVNAETCSGQFSWNVVFKRSY